MFSGMWKRVSFLVGLVLVFSTPGFTRDLSSPLSVHARISDYAVEESGSDSRQSEPSLKWLEELLTRVPEYETPENVRSEAGTAVDAGTVTDADKVVDADIIEPAEVMQTEIAAPPGQLRLNRIPPLYTSPVIEGEGEWISEDMPHSPDGQPLVYKTVYRPSLEFPNAIAYMAVFNMDRLKTRLFIGQTEPGIYQISHNPDRESLNKIVAITNAMWMQQHARGAGAIFRGQVVYPMVPGMATLVVYNDDSVDILEWTDEIPLSLIKDARQLRHLMVKDGKVVEEVVKHGKIEDAEIGLGGFLIDNQGRSTMGNKFWFLANRTAFGIREDGNLVFAMGHHISTKDLAKALVLAGCKRAIHGDANIHNIVCNFYFRNEGDKIVRRDRLSPEQLQYTMKRYDQGYAKDFFAFYEK
ncbi:phosphodiester glycosidase family protein [Desulfomonile tiedjei]|uniref:Phosphodiester glycosidase domain-containing protein n=1 Tax=Desulfomonile tiedjei (strain ATCC 49306 / DSM 6799 / DCB-1) TaxID=706587 RepID=I4CCE2_DESTA|nr:phosphodiester glycosidase family protein [Desulfomonile tiedjei]AFM27233.1 hypothetical protein Desti_4609 [Desulfomonile tiedjei DSM 6799]